MWLYWMVEGYTNCALQGHKTKTNETEALSEQKLTYHPNSVKVRADIRPKETHVGLPGKLYMTRAKSCPLQCYYATFWSNI